jgi:hypothetical protein
MEAGVDEKGAVPEEGMLDVDLKGLLDEDDGITLDFSAEEDLEVSEISEDEISDADLQALLSEAGEELNDDEEGVRSRTSGYFGRRRAGSGIGVLPGDRISASEIRVGRKNCGRRTGRHP